MRFKARREAGRLAPIAYALNLVDRKASEMEAALASADAVAGLIERLELPSRLRDVDVPPEALEQVAQRGAVDGASEADILSILRQAW
jgi:alcohol dehydrogenase class IV